METEENEVLTVKDVAKLLRISERQVQYLASEGGGPPRFRVGALWRYHRADVVAWIEAQKVRPAA